MLPTPSPSIDSPPRTRTDTAQGTMIPCACCHTLFAPKVPAQRFCKPAHRAAYAREVGIVGTLVSSRRLRRRISVTIHTEDSAVLEAPIGTRFRLVREPG